MIYSSLTHPLPRPSPRLATLRALGFDVADDDYELIDDLLEESSQN